MTSRRARGGAVEAPRVWRALEKKREQPSHIRPRAQIRSLHAARHNFSPRPAVLLPLALPLLRVARRALSPAPCGPSVSRVQHRLPAPHVALPRRLRTGLYILLLLCQEPFPSRLL